MITKAELVAFPLIRTAFIAWGQKTHNQDNVSYFLEDATDAQVLYNKYFAPNADLLLNFDGPLNGQITEAARRADWAAVKKLIESSKDHFTLIIEQDAWIKFRATVEYETALIKSLVKNPVINAANLKAAKNGDSLKAEVYPLITKAILIIGDKSTLRKGHLAKETSWIDKNHSAIKKVGAVKITKGGGLFKDKEKGKGSLEFSSTLKPYLPKLKLVLAEFTKKAVLAED
jgi:hypothetical protein